MKNDIIKRRGEGLRTEGLIRRWRKINKRFSNGRYCLRVNLRNAGRSEGQPAGYDGMNPRENNRGN